ncbi:hypothetical protein ACHAXR_012421 [Thalassiosira sp. AJA248-18]
MINPILAVGVYCLFALNNDVASASTNSAGSRILSPLISAARGSWHRNPSFISAKKPNLQYVLFQTRGGSDEEEGSTAVIDTEAAADVAESTPDSDDTSSNATEALRRNLTFTATKPHDGSVEDPDGIPSRFLLMKKNDRAEAKASFEEHLAWREEFDIDTILSRPHTKYDVCKAMLPHFFSGRDSHNNIVFVQRPAAMDFELMRNNNSTIDDLLLHYIYVIEYCWNILEPGPPEGVMTNVLDMRGLSFRNMKNQEYIGFGKRFVNMMSANYPGRSYKTLVVNAPKWFHALYKIFKPLLRESTRAKIVILKAGKHQDAALKEILGDSLPKDLLSGEGHEAPVLGTRYFLPVEEREQCEPGPNSLEEFDMRQFVSIFYCVNLFIFVSTLASFPLIYLFVSFLSLI